MVQRSPNDQRKLPLYDDPDDLVFVYGIANQAPLVDAGADVTVTLPESAALEGAVTDDGQPAPPALTVAWSKSSGPGTVTFADPSAASTSASFDIASVYVLRLTASDGELSAFDEVQVTVNSGSPCDGLCSNPTNFTIGDNYMPGNLGTGVVCRQTTSVVHGGNCGNFAWPPPVREWHPDALHPQQLVQRLVAQERRPLHQDDRRQLPLCALHGLVDAME